MIPLNVILAILVTHFLADFALQTHYQASNKSKCNKALAEHVLIYTIVFVLLGVILFVNPIGIAWGLLNGAIHFGVDYITSRINSKLWVKQRWHDFFLGVGADQLLHYICLFISYLALKP
jgi:hypothetical protein